MYTVRVVFGSSGSFSAFSMLELPPYVQQENVPGGGYDLAGANLAFIALATWFRPRTAKSKSKTTAESRESSSTNAWGTGPLHRSPPQHVLVCYLLLSRGFIRPTGGEPIHA